MGTTVTLSADVTAEVERRRRERGLGVSATINEPAQAGMASQRVGQAFRQRTATVGLRVHVSTIGDVLDSDAR